MLNLKILIFIGIQVSYFQAYAGPIVGTRNGKVMGAVINNGVSGTYYAFKSIPYAEPPIGDMRFEPPKPLYKRRSDVLDATIAGPTCLQLFTQGNESSVLGTEDCLYLNIFTPKIGHSKHSYLPVMVFIHGGGLMYGNPNFYGEQHIMSSGKMILVTIAHRLNAFGFLSTEDAVIPGNMGLKDQSVALEWIYNNIVSFGGSKNNILIAGWSSGSASINYHLVSPYTSSKWFRSAASFSGVAISPFYGIYPGEARKTAKVLAEHLKCPSNELANSQGITNCLKRRSAADIIMQIPKLFQFGQHPFNIFGPVLETSKPSKRSNVFLKKQVLSLMTKGHAKHKPWLITRTSDDGAIGAAEFLRKDINGMEGIYELNKKWNQWAPTLFFMDPRLSEKERTGLALKYKHEYFGNSDITMEKYKDLERMFNEELSTKYVQQAAKVFGENTRHGKTYAYIYDNPPPFGLGQLNAQRSDIEFGKYTIFFIYVCYLLSNTNFF